MARYNPHLDAGPIYQAARQWAQSCLVGDKSAFYDELQLWTAEVLNELDKRFVRNADEGEGDFFDKLRAQLSEGSAECRKLMAEILWILMLFQSNVGASKKRENVRLVWS